MTRLCRSSCMACISGSRGKKTTAWLLQGMSEEAGARIQSGLLMMNKPRAMPALRDSTPLQACQADPGKAVSPRWLSVAGSRGKTTTAWLLRGIFEEAGLLTGLTGSIEHSISNDRMTEEGDLWTPDEPDPTTEL